MIEKDFLEFQTPILTASSPEELEIFWYQAGYIQVNFMPYPRRRNNLNKW